MLTTLTSDASDSVRIGPGGPRATQCAVRLPPLPPPKNTAIHGRLSDPLSGQQHHAAGLPTALWVEGKRRTHKGAGEVAQKVGSLRPTVFAPNSLSVVVAPTLFLCRLACSGPLQMTTLLLACFSLELERSSTLFLQRLLHAKGFFPTESSPSRALPD